MEQIKEYFKMAIRTLRTRKIRSWLTAIGVIIGVFLIVSLLSLSEGLKSAVMQQLGMMGKDLITVVPGEIESLFTSTMGGAELTDEDIRVIKKVDGVDIVVPMNYKADVVRFGGEKKTVILYGNDWENASDIYKNDLGWSIKEGRWPNPGKNEVLIGSAVPEDIFPGIEVEDEIVIKSRKFKVIGILSSLGNKQDDSMLGLDLNIFKDITGERDGAKMAFAKLEPGRDPEKVAKNIEKELEENKKRKHKEDTASYSALTSEKITQIVSGVMALIQAVVVGFASIAIIVGGIGIMNTMYMSVSERIKEIGIMKAIGAKRSTINLIFLIESGIFGLIGGLGGAFLGFLLAKAVEIYFQIHPFVYFKASITPGLVLFSLGFSFLVGAIAGLLPARSASKMNPVDALRYE